jgi:hypothetical protein
MNGKAVSIVLVTLLMTVSSLRAEEGLGVGVIVGEPTGLSVKKWISPTHAIDAALAWSFSGNDSVQIHSDYLFHNFGVLRTDSSEGRLPLYYGLGARVKLKGDNNDNDRHDNDNDVRVGLRIPFGISYLFAQAPLDIFAEVVPVLDVVPDSDVDINVALGARFYFR